MPVVPAPPEEEMPRIEIALVPEVSIDTPGVKRTISEKSRMPFWSSASWVSAVMLMGTLLMFSSRRVAVTTISSSPPLTGALAVSAEEAAGSAAASEAARTEAPQLMQKNNNWRAAGRANGCEWLAAIGSPSLVIWTDKLDPGRQ